MVAFVTIVPPSFVRWEFVRAFVADQPYAADGQNYRGKKVLFIVLFQFFDQLVIQRVVSAQGADHAVLI